MDADSGETGLIPLATTSALMKSPGGCRYRKIVDFPEPFGPPRTVQYCLASRGN